MIKLFLVAAAFFLLFTGVASASTFSDMQRAASAASQVRANFNSVGGSVALISFARQRGLCFGRATNFGQLPQGTNAWPMLWLGMFDVLGRVHQGRSALYNRSASFLQLQERRVRAPYRRSLEGTRQFLNVGRNFSSRGLYCTVLQNWKNDGYRNTYYHIYRYIPQQTFAYHNSLFQSASQKLEAARQFTKQRWGEGWANAVSLVPQNRFLQVFFRRGL